MQNDIHPNLQMSHSRMFAAIQSNQPLFQVEKIYHDIIMRGVKPDIRTFNYLLGLCARDSDRQAAKRYLEEAKSKGTDVPSAPEAFLTDAVTYVCNEANQNFKA